MKLTIKQYLKQAIMLQLILLVHLSITKQLFKMVVLKTRLPDKLNVLILQKTVQNVLLTVPAVYKIAKIVLITVPPVNMIA
jgi:hypothetical protein